MGQGMAVRRTALLLGLLAGLVAGCGSDRSSSIEAGLLQKAKTVFQEAKTSRAARTAATDTQPLSPEAAAQLRMSLEAVGVPVQRVRIAALGADTFITLRDTNSGTATFQTADGSAFTFRDGVLISTRGAVTDLMSAATPSAGQIRAAAGRHKRSYFVLGDNDGTTRLEMDCALSFIGTETLDVIGRPYATRHVRETCEGAGRMVENDYWVDGGGTFRKSKQWVTDFLGYVEFTRVID